MGLALDQIYLRANDTERPAAVIREYCSQRGAQFVPHQRYRLEGVKQVLGLIAHRRKRRYYLLPTCGDWVCVWEVVDHSTFADPGLVCFLSEALHSMALWLTIDQGYNMWAYQVFANGRLEEEVFLPEEYFLGNTEADLDTYGDCHDFAGEFNGRMHLPHFLMSPRELDRQKEVKSLVVKLECPIAP